MGLNNCSKNLVPFSAPISRGMQVDYNTLNYCFPLTVKEVSLRAKFVNTSSGRGEDRFFVLRARHELGRNALH